MATTRNMTGRRSNQATPKKQTSKKTGEKAPCKSARKKTAKGGGADTAPEQDAVEYIIDVLLKNFADADLQGVL